MTPLFGTHQQLSQFKTLSRMKPGGKFLPLARAQRAMGIKSLSRRKPGVKFIPLSQAELATRVNSRPRTTGMEALSFGSSSASESSPMAVPRDRNRFVQSARRDRAAVSNKTGGVSKGAFLGSNKNVLIAISNIVERFVFFFTRIVFQFNQPKSTFFQNIRPNGYRGRVIILDDCEVTLGTGVWSPLRLECTQTTFNLDFSTLSTKPVRKPMSPVSSRFHFFPLPTKYLTGSLRSDVHYVNGRKRLAQ